MCIRDRRGSRADGHVSGAPAGASRWAGGDRSAGGVTPDDGTMLGTRGCGFCVVNNAAVGAVYALDVHRKEVERVAIIDIDVHHGNGTEAI
eukprot:2553714-Rhodomonas_salina.1